MSRVDLRSSALQVQQFLEQCPRQAANYPAKAEFFAHIPELSIDHSSTGRNEWSAPSNNYLDHE